MTDTHWKWCGSCGDLVGSSGAPCVKYERHDTNSQQFLVLKKNDPAAPGQHGWRHCTKCDAIVYEAAGTCHVTKGPHVMEADDYAVPHDSNQSPAFPPFVVTVPEWRWCSKCQALYRGAGRPCPAGDNHGAAPSGHYTLPTSAQLLRVRTPARRVFFTKTGLGFDFTWSTAAAGDGGSLAPGQGAWAARAVSAGAARLYFHEVIGSDSGDIHQKRSTLIQLNAHLFTPDLIITLHAFAWNDAVWDDRSPEIEFRRIG